MEDNVIIRVQGLSHRFGDGEHATQALESVSFSVRRGEFFIVLGPSGCGKSTLLRIVAGLVRPTKGSVVFSSPEEHRRLSMVFQGFAVFPWMTVRDNVSFGLRMRGVAKEQQHRISDGYLETLKLQDVAYAYPRELSGGMRQRVGLARALAVDPDVLLMDEPFSQLDAFTAERLRNELLALWQREHFTVVMVTHLIEEAILLGDRIAVMTPRPGHIEMIVENTLPRPRNDRDAKFWELEDRLTEAVRF